MSVNRTSLWKDVGTYSNRKFFCSALQQVMVQNSHLDVKAPQNAFKGNIIREQNKASADAVFTGYC